MTDQSSFATPRLAAGALFVDHDNVLLVCKTYGNKWDIPGGYVEPGESPAAACERELVEEIGLKREVKRLLVHDWAPNDHEGDKMLYIFDCGTIDKDDQINIKVDGVEIESVKWVPIDQVDDYVIPRLSKRLKHAYRAHASGETLYLEYGAARRI